MTDFDWRNERWDRFSKRFEETHYPDNTNFEFGFTGFRPTQGDKPMEDRVQEMLRFELKQETPAFLLVRIGDLPNKTWFAIDDGVRLGFTFDFRNPLEPHPKLDTRDVILFSSGIGPWKETIDNSVLVHLIRFNSPISFRLLLEGE